MKLSIVCISYNQEKFIRQCLNGFINQEVRFEYEIIVADDASTDRTPEIVRQYARVHPRIRALLRPKNLGVQRNLIDALQKAKGEYIALCEGDDYWSDSSKLQIQIDFMESNPEYGLCFHPVRVFYENGEKPDEIYPHQKDPRFFTVDQLLKQNFIQTNSVVYRKRNYTDIPANILPLDWYLHLFHAQFGKIGFIDKVMSSYRRHGGGVWWESNRDVDKLWRQHGLAHLALYNELLKLYGQEPKYEAIIRDLISRLLADLARVDSNYGDNLVLKAMELYPDILHRFIVGAGANLAQKEGRILELQQDVGILKHDIEVRDALIQRMKDSKFWQARNLAAKIAGKPKI